MHWRKRRIDQGTRGRHRGTAYVHFSKARGSVDNPAPPDGLAAAQQPVDSPWTTRRPPPDHRSAVAHELHRLWGQPVLDEKHLIQPEEQRQERSFLVMTKNLRARELLQDRLSPVFVT